MDVTVQAGWKILTDGTATAGTSLALSKKMTVTGDSAGAHETISTISATSGLFAVTAEVTFKDLTFTLTIATDSYNGIGKELFKTGSSAALTLDGVTITGSAATSTVSSGDNKRATSAIITHADGSLTLKGCTFSHMAFEDVPFLDLTAGTTFSMGTRGTDKPNIFSDIVRKSGSGSVISIDDIGENTLVISNGDFDGCTAMEERYVSRDW